MKKITFLIAAFIFGLNSYAQDDLWPAELVFLTSSSVCVFSTSKLPYFRNKNSSPSRKIEIIGRIMSFPVT